MPESFVKSSESGSPNLSSFEIKPGVWELEFSGRIMCEREVCAAVWLEGSRVQS